MNNIPNLRSEKLMKYKHVDWLYCPNCKKETDHLARFTDHERDTSADHFICQVCKWEYSGVTGKYEPPCDET